MPLLEAPVELTHLHPNYPSRLRSLHDPPSSLYARGDTLEAAKVVAIVGSRDAVPEAAKFARQLAQKLVGQDVVVVSGGALGIDGAAHRGALDAGGRTWIVAPTGHLHVFPNEHAELFEEVARGPGAVIWPFAPKFRHRSGFLARNYVLVALADAVVVVQAGIPSGALRAAGCARTLGKPLWVCAPPPWADAAFDGSRQLLDRPDRSRARPLYSMKSLFDSMGLSGTPRTIPHAPAISMSEADTLRVLSMVPLHLDEIAALACLPTQAVAAALLTLALENVVVEGPPGFFRRH